jgi:hypothetical protein
MRVALYHSPKLDAILSYSDPLLQSFPKIYIHIIFPAPMDLSCGSILKGFAITVTNLLYEYFSFPASIHLQ